MIHNNLTTPPTISEPPASGCKFRRGIPQGAPEQIRHLPRSAQNVYVSRDSTP